MPCAAYTDPRLAAVYDTLNPPTPDLAFYLELAGAAPQTAPKTVLDMGCGTGRLARALAARGHRVTGADPAAAMLEIARGRAGGERGGDPGDYDVTWVETDAAGLAVDTRFDLAIMTGHVFQVFLEDRAVRAALANLRRHLAPGGRLAFETRNPAVRDWESWRPAETRVALRVPGLGPVQVHYDIRAVEGALVTFETHFRFAPEFAADDPPGDPPDFAPDDVVVAPHTLRFMGQGQLAAFLAEAGFAEVAWYGDWDRSPVTSTSPEIIAIAG